MADEIRKSRKTELEKSINRDKRMDYNLPGSEILREHDNSSFLNLLSQVDRTDKNNDRKNK